MKSTARARELRERMTDAERTLWKRLRGSSLSYSFRRQHPIGPYIVDFVCLEKRLVVEVDGGQHFESARDAERDAWLSERGYRVVRFWNNEVLGNLQGVLESIRQALEGEAA